MVLFSSSKTGILRLQTVEDEEIFKFYDIDNLNSLREPEKLFSISSISKTKIKIFLSFIFLESLKKLFFYKTLLRVVGEAYLTRVSI